MAAFAHHSYTAEFDLAKPVKLTGVLTKVEWTNPHIWIYLDVKDDKGVVTNWGFSASPPGMLTRRGITKGTLKLGEVLTVSGHRAKDGSNNASGNVVTFSDGRDALIGQDQAGGESVGSQERSREVRSPLLLLAAAAAAFAQAPRA